MLSGKRREKVIEGRSWEMEIEDPAEGRMEDEKVDCQLGGHARWSWKRSVE